MGMPPYTNMFNNPFNRILAISTCSSDGTESPILAESSDSKPRVKYGELVILG